MNVEVQYHDINIGRIKFGKRLIYKPSNMTTDLVRCCTTHIFIVWTAVLPRTALAVLHRISSFYLELKLFFTTYFVQILIYLILLSDFTIFFTRFRYNSGLNKQNNVFL